MSDGYKAGPTVIVDPAAPQTITGSWANMGGTIQTTGYKKFGFWFKLDINGSQNVRFRFIPKLSTTDTDLYNFMIKTISANDVKLEQEYYEINVDADLNGVPSFDLDNLVPAIQVQVMAETVGSPAAVILSAHYTLGN